MPPLQAIPITALTSFDWFLILLVLLSTFAAFTRGIIKALFSLGGVIAGIFLASWNYLSLASKLHPLVTSFAAAQVTAFLLILFAVVVVFTLAGSMLRSTAAAVGLGLFDRLLGALFGLLRGILLGVATMMVITAFTPKSSWKNDSRLAPYFLAGAHAVSFVVPEHLRQQLTAGANYLLQQSPKLLRPYPFTQSR